MRLELPPTAADTVVTTALVLKVVDGDTIDIRDDNRGRLRVRLQGIDTPEEITGLDHSVSAGRWVDDRLIAVAFAFSTDEGFEVVAETIAENEEHGERYIAETIATVLSAAAHHRKGW